ncbi:hypothetical protein CPB85DRAFT_1528053 [Mucidula mucida]|nr:hypothetical protein CPB85DRAFT_1528053 [Mucidula mucida]
MVRARVMCDAKESEYGDRPIRSSFNSEFTGLSATIRAEALINITISSGGKYFVYLEARQLIKILRHPMTGQRDRHVQIANSLQADVSQMDMAIHGKSSASFYTVNPRRNQVNHFKIQRGSDAVLTAVIVSGCKSAATGIDGKRMAETAF